MNDWRNLNFKSKKSKCCGCGKIKITYYAYTYAGNIFKQEEVCFCLKCIPIHYHLESLEY